MKYFHNLKKEYLERKNFDFDKLLNDPQDYLGDLDLLPSMCGGQDYTPDFDDGETAYIKLANRVFAFEVYTGECIEATWAHTINLTDIKNFREIENVDELVKEKSKKRIIQIDRQIERLMKEKDKR